LRVVVGESLKRKKKEIRESVGKIREEVGTEACENDGETFERLEHVGGGEERGEGEGGVNCEMGGKWWGEIEMWRN
jgi:hypothetical protein